MTHADEHARNIDRETPIRALVRGAAAGLAASLVLSSLSRVLPGLWNERGKANGGKPPLPADPEDPQQVLRWQTESQSPAAFRPPPEAEAPGRSGTAPGITPVGALTIPQGPGPEGLAEQFAFKVAAGGFEQDITHQIRPIGLATHLAYGSAWGALYGILQASYRLPAESFGALYGLVVYSVGPALLVPAMKIMRPPREEPPERTSLLIVGHLVYGVTVAQVFRALHRPRD